MITITKFLYQKKTIYINKVVAYLDLLTYFYITLLIVFLPAIIINKYYFELKTSYNT